MRIPYLKVLWTAAVLTLIIAILVQRDRLSRLNTESADLRAEVVRINGEALAYESHLLIQLAAFADSVRDIDHESPQGPVLYILAEQDCAASERALRSLGGSPHGFDVRVGSFKSSPDELTHWLGSISSDMRPASEAFDREVFSRMPRGVTPITLVMLDGQPVDVLIGQPSTEWMARFAGT